MAFQKYAHEIPTIIYCVPTALPDSARPLVFDCIDDFGWFGNKRDEEKDILQYKLAERADIIWTTSDILYKRWYEEFPTKTYLIPNGADVVHFSCALRYKSINNSMLLPARKKALVGYFGAISNWFDFGLIIAVARMLSDVQFVLVGPLYCKSRHDWPENVSLIGEKPYAELPKLLRECDCCIIPFVINDLTNATNPIKLFEYFAAGKPVVSTPLPEVLKYRSIGVLETAETPEEYAAAIERCIKFSLNADLVKERHAIAQNNSWEIRFELAYKTMEPFMLKAFE